MPRRRPGCNATGGGSGSGGISSRSTQIRAAAAYARQVLLGLASTQLGVPVAQLTTARGVVSGGGKTVKYGDLLGGKLFNFKMTAQTTATPGQGVAKPVAEYKVVGKLVPADRHPGQGRRASTPTSRTSASPGCCTRGASAPAAPAPTRRRTTSRSASTRTRSSTSRALRSCGSTTSSPSWRRRSTTRSRLLRSSRSSGRAIRSCRAPATSGAGSARPATPTRRTRRATRPAARRPTVCNQGLAGAAKTVSATYMYQYNSFMPIGPHCAVADVAWTASARRSGSPSRRSTGVPDRISRAHDRRHPGGELPRHLQRGRELVRRRSVGRGLRAGRDPLEVHEEAGARAVDALGPARLGSRRHGEPVGRHDGRQRERQDRRRRLADLRPAAGQQRHHQGAARHELGLRHRLHVAVRPG